MLLALALVELLFPFSRPVTLVLASRARAEAKEACQVTLVKTLTAAKYPPQFAGLYLDVGPVVDRVCAELASMTLDPIPSSGAAPSASTPVWHDQGRFQAALRTACRKVLIDDGVAPPVCDPFTTDRSSLMGSASSLPNWVVESVEITVMRALLERYNVSRFVAVVSERITPTGNNWGYVELYLEQVKNRLLETKADIIPFETPSSLALRAVVSSHQAKGVGSDDWTLDCLVEAVPSADSPPHSQEDIRLALYSQSGAEIAALTHRVEMPERRLKSVQRIEFKNIPSTEIPAKIVGIKLAATGSVEHIGIPLPVPRDPASLDQVRVLFDGPQVEDWRQSLEFIRNAAGPPGSPSVADSALKPWIERIRQTLFALDPRKLLAVDSAPDSETIVIGEVAAKDRLVIFPFKSGLASSDVAVETPVTGRPVAVGDPHGHHRGEAMYASLPGVDSFDELPLEPGCRELFFPDSLEIARHRTVKGELVLGATTNEDVPAFAIACRLKRDTTDSGRLAVVTVLAIDAAAQGVLLQKVGATARPRSAFELAKFCAGWSAIFDAISHAGSCSFGGPDGTFDDGTTAQPDPSPVLDYELLDETRQLSSWPRLVAVLLGLAGYASWTIHGLKNRPIPPD